MAYTAGAQKSVLLYSGLNPQVVHIQGAAGGSANAFYDGDLVQSDSNGELVIGASKTYLGTARKAFSTTDNVEIPVELIDIHSIYTGRVLEATTTSEAYIGDGLACTFTPGAFVWAIGGTDEAYCVGLHPVDGAKAGGRLLFRFRYESFVETT